MRVGTMAAAGCMFAYGGQNRLAQQYEVLVVEKRCEPGNGQGVSMSHVSPPSLTAPHAPGSPQTTARSPNGYRRVRAKEIASLGAYKINAVVQTDANGRDASVVQENARRHLGGVRHSAW